MFTFVFHHLRLRCKCCLISTMVLLALGCGQQLPPVLPKPLPPPTVDLPPDSAVLELDEHVQLTAPFAVGRVAGASGGQALVLREGTVSADLRGRAMTTVELPKPGHYRFWLRVRWQDSCSNSVGLELAGGAPLQVGQDSVYGTWQWLDVGRFELSSGVHELRLLEREDGIAIDQLLYTTDPQFTPTGLIGSAEEPGIRRFADDFSRSPGHGLDAWDTQSGDWSIAFSYDPNRIPNQYTLVGRLGPAADAAPDETSAAPARCFARGRAWDGARVAFALRPLSAGTFGVSWRTSSDAEPDLELTMKVADDGETAQVSLRHGAYLRDETVTGLRIGQWHRVSVENWAWVTRLSIDDQVVFSDYKTTPAARQPGLCLLAGSAAFDDVVIEGVRWMADNGRQLNLGYRPDEGARWFHGDGVQVGDALVGEAGRLAVSLPEWPLAEVVLENGLHGGPAAVHIPGLQTVDDGVVRLFQGRAAPGAVLHLEAAGEDKVAVRRMACRFEWPRQDDYHIGPYHFTYAKIPDPSDYLDFTEEEYAAMKADPDAQKLRRSAKMRPLVAKGEKAVWWASAGAWRVADGLLHGSGRPGTLTHSRDLTSDMRFVMRVRLTDPTSAAAVSIYGGDENGITVHAHGNDYALPEGANGVALPDGRWHDLEIVARNGNWQAHVGGQQLSGTWKPTMAGQIALRVDGGAVFDDVDCIIPRHSEHGDFSAFDRRETSWWRTGSAWLDHGGIACVLASNWVSLVAPESVGILWQKRALGPDMQLSFYIEEYTEWFGWEKKPSHEHFAFDNIHALLAPERSDATGYRLEVNSRNRQYTVLYRNNVPVAEREQGKDFPITYRGGHAPYHRRFNRIALAKRGAEITATVNGQVVLRYHDAAPIPVQYAGVGGRETRVNFSQIETRRLHILGETKSPKQAANAAQ